MGGPWKLKFHAFLLLRLHPFVGRKVRLVLRVIDSQRHRRTVEIASFFSPVEQLIR